VSKLANEVEEKQALLDFLEQKQRTIEQRLRYTLGRWNQQLMGELKSNAQCAAPQTARRRNRGV
jgi:hypothetical protein